MSTPDSAVSAFLAEHAVFAWAGLISLLFTMAVVFLKKFTGLVGDAWVAFTGGALAVVRFHYEFRKAILQHRKELEELQTGVSSDCSGNRSASGVATSSHVSSVVPVGPDQRR